MTIIINNDLTVVNQMWDVTIFSISFYDVTKFDIEGQKVQNHHRPKFVRGRPPSTRPRSWLDRLTFGSFISLILKKSGP